MKARMLVMLAVAGTMFLTTGCKSLFISKSSTAQSRWHNYAEVESDFGKIIPYQTNTNDLKALGFFPSLSPNIKVLTYPDIIQIFMPNTGMRKEDLPPAVRDCIDAHEQSFAYQIELKNIYSKRHGNLFLDIFGFKRNTHSQGWDFKGLILIKGGVVVYKLDSGEPEISLDDKVVHPLGPLQELDGAILNVVNIPK